MKQFYQGYDPATKTANWVCTKGQQQAQHDGWPCSAEYAKVSVAVELLAQLNEDNTGKTYVVTSAIPGNAPNAYDCHACAPAIGVAVFAWRQSQWQLESANAAIGFYGGFGDAPTVDLATIGPERHAVMLWHQDIAQGYAWSNRWLLVPLKKDVQEAWSIQDENDNLSAVDPADKFAEHTAYRAVAVARFLVSDEMDHEGYYDIEVMSRGKDRQDSSHPMKNENWTKVFRLRDGQYRLLRTTPYAGAKASQKKSGAPQSARP